MLPKQVIGLYYLKIFILDGNITWGIIEKLNVPFFRLGKLAGFLPDQMFQVFCVVCQLLSGFNPVFGPF